MASTGYFIEPDSKTQLYFRYWHVENPKVCVILIHGLGEHSGRYNDLTTFFVSKSIAVCGFDLRGHGNSTGKKGHTSSYNLYYKDIDRVIVEARNHFGTIPVVLYGHSLGGNIALNYFIDQKPQISAMIVTSPWLKLSNQPQNYKLAIVKYLKLVAPFLSFGNNLKNENLSRNSNVCNEYKSDPLVHDSISIKLFSLAVQGGKKVANQGYRINIPMLVMHGTADNITSCKASATFVRNTGKYTTYKDWEGAYHELHNDINNEEVFQYTYEWLLNEKLV